MNDVDEPGHAVTDIRVLHGNPTEVEVAALVVALTPVVTDDRDAQDDGHGVGPAVPAWTRAALLEGVGGATVHAPDGLSRSGR